MEKIYRQGNAYFDTYYIHTQGGYIGKAGGSIAINPLSCQTEQRQRPRVILKQKVLTTYLFRGMT